MSDVYFNPKLQVQAEAVRSVLARVVAVIPEFGQAELATADGYRYALTEMTDGIRLRDVTEGQVYECVVTVRYPRVLKATLQ